MDYLDILSTRSLLLFSPPSPQSKSQSLSAPLHDDESPNTTPSTPLAQLPDTNTPSPISMPVQSMMEPSTDCVYFLLTHVLATAFQSSDSEASPGGPGQLGSSPSGGGGGLGGTPKEIIGEAELLVWKEMDKAKMFARELAQWFRGHGNSRISEQELENMAGKWGLRVQPLGGAADVESEKSHAGLERYGASRIGQAVSIV